ncbi:MAG: phosphatidylserine/phosphatidylglycerophosphate/cardiolipin synthase family protein, partial [Candidatus Ornithospirochaeta sp.]
RIWNEGSVDQINPESFPTGEGDKGEHRAWLFNRNAYNSDVSISGLFSSLIASAEESIFLCPYLPTADSNMKECLRNAVDRGVDVEVWCSQDSRGYAKAGSSWAVSDFIKDTGVTFHDVTYGKDGEEKSMYHMKMMVIDDRYLVVGSVNYNFRSMTLSHEIGLVLDSPEAAKKAKSLAMESAGDGVVLDEESALEAKKKYGNYFAYLFSFFGG